MKKKVLNIYINESKLHELIHLLKSKTRMRSPISISTFKEILNKVFIYLNTDINNYETIKKDKLIYTDLTKLVHPKHICFIHHILKLLFNFTEEEINKIKIHDYDYKIKLEDLNPDYISTEELDLLYEKANDLEKLILYLFMSTGMRCAGVANINSINYENKTFKTLEKYNKEVSYKIVSPLIENLFKSTKYFNKKRKCITIRRIINNLKIKCNLAHCKHIHPHAFRHTFAKMNLYSGTNLLTVSKLLNHKNTNITESIYLKERIIDIVEREELPFMINEKKFVFVVPQIWIDLKNNGY
jgi:integrase